MKITKIFLLGILEAFKLAFNKKAVEKEAETEFSLPVEDSSHLSEQEKEAQYQANSLEMLKEYNVNVFTKWLLLGIAALTAAYGAYLVANKSPLFVLPAITSFLIYKLYENRRDMAHMRLCLIQFIFQTEDEVNKLKETT